MISKSRRRNTGSVERLQQASFTMVKGIDEQASILDVNTVLHLKNLDIENDGSIVLRKPLKFVCEFPNVAGVQPSRVIPIVHGYYFLIYNIGENNYVTIVNNDVSVPITIQYTSYTDFSEHEIPSTELIEIEYPLSGGKGVAYLLDFFNLNDLSYANLSTATLVYGTKVYFKHDTFKGQLVNLNLIQEDAVTRALSIYTAPEDPSVVYIKIYATEPTTLTSGEALALDAELYSDEPYAIRDAYDQSISDVKGIVFYGNAVKVNDEIRPSVQYTGNESDQYAIKNIVAYPDVSSASLSDWVSQLRNISLTGVEVHGAPSPNVFYLKYPLNEHSGAFKCIRGGVQLFEIPSVEISYTLSDEGWSLPSEVDPTNDNSDTGFNPVLEHFRGEYVLETLNYSRLGSLYAKYTDSLMSASTASSHVALYSDRIECKCAAQLEFDTIDLANYFTKNTSAGVPEAVSDFAHPDQQSFQNFIPRALFTLFAGGMVDLGDLKWMYWNRDSAVEKDFSWVRCDTYSNEKYRYISFLKLVLPNYQGGITSNYRVAKSLTLRIPNLIETSKITFGIKDLRVQGYPLQDVLYRVK